MTTETINKRLHLNRKLYAALSLHRLQHDDIKETDLLNECLLEGLHAIGILDDDEYELLKKELE